METINSPKDGATDNQADQDRAKRICQRYAGLLQEKNLWNRVWQDASDYVLPRRGSFYTQQIPGAQNDKIYDSTAPWALEQLASGLHSYLTSTTQRWLRFALPVEIAEDLMQDDEVNIWLQKTTDIMYGVFNSQKSNFNPQAHEMYLDLGAFGTGIMYAEENYILAPVRFCTYHLSEIVIDENAYGMVDTIGRKFRLSGRQALELWPAFPSSKFQEQVRKDPMKKFEFLHFVTPRTDFIVGSELPRNMTYASYYLWPEENLMISEGGYREFPFMAPRWSKLTGERYGRSPAMTCLPDIKMVNAMAKTVLQAAQKVVSPPLMAPDEGFMLPIKTAPDSINYYSAGLDPNNFIKPLETKGNIGIGLDLIDSRRQHIIRSFFVDWMNLQEGPQMTATEVMTRSEEKMRMMAPAVSRQQSEFLDPLVDRTFAILMRKGYFGQVPQQIYDAAKTRGMRSLDLKVEYVSPVARAQRMTQVMGFQRMMESLSAIATVKPEVMDKIDGDGVVDFMADVHDVSYKTLLSDKEVAQVRQNRQDATAQANEAAVMNQHADSFNKAAQGASKMAETSAQ